MENNYEHVRNKLMANLYSILPSEHVENVLSVFDKTMYIYEIIPKNKDIVPVEERVPEIVKYYIVSKSIPLHIMQTLLGHEKPETTMRYTDLNHHLTHYFGIQQLFSESYLICLLFVLIFIL